MKLDIYTFEYIQKRTTELLSFVYEKGIFGISDEFDKDVKNLVITVTKPMSKETAVVMIVDSVEAAALKIQAGKTLIIL